MQAKDESTVCRFCFMSVGSGGHMAVNKIYKIRYARATVTVLQPEMACVENCLKVRYLHGVPENIGKAVRVVKYFYKVADVCVWDRHTRGRHRSACRSHCGQFFGVLRITVGPDVINPLTRHKVAGERSMCTKRKALRCRMGHGFESCQCLGDFGGSVPPESFG